MYRLIFVILLCACAAKTPPHASLVAEADTIGVTDRTVHNYSAPDLLARYVREREGAAVYLSGRNCPGENARADSLLNGLLKMAESQERTLDFTLSWEKLLTDCKDQRIAAWYRNAISKPQADVTSELLTQALLRTNDRANIEAVKKASLNPNNNIAARSRMLSALVENAYYGGDKRVELMIESYRRTGEVPTDFVANQALPLWMMRASNWREALLAEVVADPTKPGAPQLLLTLAKETTRTSEKSRWRKAWETGLQTIEQNPQTSTELKSMVPIAREVAQYRKD